MTSDPPPVPTTWPELLARHADPDAGRRGFDYCQRRFAGLAVESPFFAVPFASCAECVAYTLVLRDAAVGAGLIGELAPYLARIARDREELNRMPPARIAALSLVAMADLTGVALPATVGKAVPRMLAALGAYGTLDAEEARQAIWAHLAFGEVAELGELLPGDLAAPPEDGAFGPNVQGAQIQLARAIAHRAPAAAVVATWDSYRNHTPRLVAARQGSMLELLLAARAMGCVLSGQAGPRVLDDLRAAVR
ncbi:MAG: hypothetical protein OZ921_12465 [Sorangiineae bacterium]|nr:hypothetical protein [Polyangiaceae bacterium]MEB2323320.1 hypothetical protein [Sorangiineae bacterium]